jgi:hypothetical protein
MGPRPLSTEDTALRTQDPDPAAPPDASTGSRSDAPSGPVLTLNVESIAWSVVIAAAALLRLTDLTALPLRPDESLRARAAFDLSRGTVTPDWFGDLGSGLAALSFRLAGDSAWLARLWPALFGIAAVAALALYRPMIGKGAALVAAVLIAVSPVAVINARSIGPEAAAFPLALLIPPLVARVMLNGRTRWLPVLAAVIGLGLGTGALVTAVMVVTLAWLGIELGWLNGRAAAWKRETTSRASASSFPRLDRRVLALSLLALVPGLALAVLRYGSGLDRLTLSSVRAWSGAPEPAAPVEPWYWVPAVLVAYEPLVLALGGVGLVIALRRWNGPDRAGHRLAVVWAVAGLAITLFWLRRDPSTLLVLVAPLALLGGIATATATRRVIGAGMLERTGLALLPLVPAVGYALVSLVGWASAQQITVAEAAAFGLVVAGGVVATLGLVHLLRAPAAFALLVTAWLVLGGLTLHATTNAAFDTGSEFLQSVRTLPETDAIVLQVDRATAPGEIVWIERRLWPALAWPLRAYPTREFVETPPGGPAVVPVDARGAPVTERWTPSEWDLLGVLRWWVARAPWGAVERQQAAVTR